ncbi:hypothetical protein MKK58_23920 [Methylobacterium sp. J-078]|uniref:hypothetical protein n=1 Tax=Methylobacterium sp. J-078 TaxID=2836657 RepID=UPI001FBA590C|nr:hypothetical protein [Methylobacterium sp. J-078]MCJ2047565.1 hypothetical protein [Methylobacterium sp. J-078]
MRAVTAVIALYAFVLNAILGGLVPLPASISHGVLCLGQADDASPAVPDPSHAHHQSCCTVAGPMLQVALPEIDAHAVVWPPRAVLSRIAWQRKAAHFVRGPPGAIPRPRGPPVV